MEQNKTLREWYNEMPHPYNEQAIKNATVQGIDVDGVMVSHTEALNTFHWSITPESKLDENYWADAYYGRYPHATQPVAIASGDTINGQRVTLIEPANPKVPVYQGLKTQFEGKPDREILLLLVDQVNDLTQLVIQLGQKLAAKTIVNSDIHQMD